MLAWDIATPSAVAMDDDDGGPDGPEFEEDMELAADDDFDDDLDDDLDAELDDDDPEGDLDDDEFEDDDYEEYEEYEEFADGGGRRPHHVREEDWDG